MISLITDYLPEKLSVQKNYFLLVPFYKGMSSIPAICTFFEMNQNAPSFSLFENYWSISSSKQNRKIQDASLTPNGKKMIQDVSSDCSRESRGGPTGFQGVKG